MSSERSEARKGHRQHSDRQDRTNYGICLEPPVEFVRIRQIVPPISHDDPPPKTVRRATSLLSTQVWIADESDQRMFATCLLKGLLFDGPRPENLSCCAAGRIHPANHAGDCNSAAAQEALEQVRVLSRLALAGKQLAPSLTVCRRRPPTARCKQVTAVV